MLSLGFLLLTVQDLESSEVFQKASEVIQQLKSISNALVYYKRHQPILRSCGTTDL